MKNYTCNVCGEPMKTSRNKFNQFLDWKLPDSLKAKYRGRTLRATVEIKFKVTASIYLKDDYEEDTDICNACIKKYLPKEVTKR